MIFRSVDLCARGFAVALLSVATFCVGCSHDATPAGAADGKGKGKGANADRIVPVLTAQVEKKDVPIWLEGLGSATGFYQVTVHTQVDGRLDQVLFKEGQEVHRGQVLAQIDPRPYLIQEHNGEGALARDKAQYEGAKANLDRYSNLAGQKLLGQQQVDDQHALVGQAEGAVRIDQATIETAKLNLDYARITSPIEGVVGIRMVDPGNIVHAADATGIVLITQIDPIAVLFTLPQDELVHVSEALARGKVDVEAWDRESKVRLGSGTLALIDNQINQATATLKLKAIFANPNRGPDGKPIARQLWPNQFVKARLLLDTIKGALVLPATAVQRGPQGPIVYVVADDQSVTSRPVTTGPTAGDLVILTKGVELGETVVVEGQNQLRNGSKVQARPQHAAPEGAGAGAKAREAAAPPGRPVGTGMHAPTPTAAAAPKSEGQR